MRVCSSKPNGQVFAGDDGVGAAQRFATVGDGAVALLVGDAGETFGDGRVEEAVVEQCRVQDAGLVAEHGFDSLFVGDDTGEPAQFAVDVGDSPPQVLGASPGEPAALEGADDEVEQLGQVGCLSFGVDFLAEPGGGGSGVTLEHGDLRMLVLDGAGDVTERAVADVPGEGAAELPERQRPRAAVDVGDVQFGDVAEAAVAVGDEPLQL